MDNKKSKNSSSQNYWLMPTNNSKTKDFKFNYNTPGYNTPGRGFGNLNVANEIRNGNSSREDTKEYRENREATQMFEHQFSFLDRNFQDPKHIVMPIPRGGESTRSQNQLSVDTMRSNNMNINKQTNNRINFNY
jgi:hypothetical protein